MLQIVQLPGTDERLYKLVAPLVMNPTVLKQNNNFPFRTTERFVWFVAVEGDQVEGFLPVENRRGKSVINNYYVHGCDASLLTALVKEAVCRIVEAGDTVIEVVALVADVPVFKSLHFDVETVWTRYVRMRKVCVRQEKKSND